MYLKCVLPEYTFYPNLVAIQKKSLINVTQSTF